LSVTYAAGAIAAKADYTSWSKQDELSTAATPAAMTTKSRVRLSGAYDMGVARLSAGYSQLERTTSVTTKETLLGVKVPMGAVTLGLDYAIGQVTNQEDTTGYSLGLGYDLSKRTNIGASVASYKLRTGPGAASGAAAAENTNLFRVLVAHSF
jgi:predicted porin